jgi:putative transposase
MNLAAWAERSGVARVAAYRWFCAGLLPVAAMTVGRLILVDKPDAGVDHRTAVYARVWSADQKADLDRQVARVTAWAATRQISVDKVVTEVGSALNGHRCRFLALLCDSSVQPIVVEQRGRFCRFGSEYVQAALAARGRELVVVDTAEVDEDLVGDMTEILSSMCARLYGKRAAQNRARRAVAAAAADDCPGCVMARFGVPAGCTAQAFRFTLDPTEDQACTLARHFGVRRRALNWTVAALKADIAAWHAAGVETAKRSLRVLRKRWNTVKSEVCVNAETGQVWWPECSKEASADGISGAVDAYWNWQASRAGKRAGKRVGFPRLKTKGRDNDRVSFTIGAMRVEPDRRHLTLVVIGTVRTHENTRRIERLIRAGRARVLAISLRRNGTRIDASVRVLVQRPQQPKVAHPGSRVGVDVGVRRLATVADADGTLLERVRNPRPLDAALKELRHASRARSRCVKGSRRYRERTTEMSRLHRRVNDVRTRHLHVLTTRLAKTHGRIVVEGLDAAGMLRQKGLPGARARRRGLSDAALGTPRRHLAYKTRWYRSQLMVADRWFPSSKTCHLCRHVQDIGWDEKWQCDGCSVIHQRDDNAAVNLARYEATVSVVGPVGAAVKRGADRKTGPRPAGGRQARKGRSRKAAEQPRDGVQVA